MDGNYSFNYFKCANINHDEFASVTDMLKEYNDIKKQSKMQRIFILVIQKHCFNNEQQSIMSNGCVWVCRF